MTIRMTSRSRRPESSHLQFRKKIPVDLKGRIEGRRVIVEFPACAGHEAVLIAMKVGVGEIKASLRTSQKDVAKLRTAAANTAVERMFQGIRKGASTLSHRQVVALAGEVYRGLVAQWEQEPGTVEQWSSWKAWSRAIMEGRVGAAPTATFADAEDVGRAVERFGRDLTAGINALPTGDAVDEGMEVRFGFLADFALARHGLNVDSTTRSRLRKEVGRSSTDAAWALKRAADGDYSPDPKATRFPLFSAASPGVTLTALFDAWKDETRPTASTLATWRGCFRTMREFVGHDDAERLTEHDLIRWKDHLLADDKKPRTIRDNHLTCVRSVLAHAVRNRKLPSNPAANVRVTVKVIAGEGRLPYSDDEIAKLLDLAALETKAYLRWLPLLAVTTGARIGELAQLHAQHVVVVDGFPCLRIEPTNDGGTIKNASSERLVPIHPDVIAAGFLDWVKRHGPGPLFYGRSSGDLERMHASKGVTNRVRAWVRNQGFVDPRKSPMHATRHWFKSAAVRAEVRDSVADAIQGHAAKTVAGAYRHFDVATLAKAVAAIPIPCLPLLE